MRPENETIRRKRDLEFQSRVLAAVEKQKEYRFWALLNRPFTLWLLSLILLTLGGAYFSAYVQCRAAAYAEIDKLEKVIVEISYRRSHVKDILDKAQNVASLRGLASTPYSFNPEFKDYPFRLMRDLYERLALRVVGNNPYNQWPMDWDAKFFDIANGDVAPSISDDDLPALRKLIARQVDNDVFTAIFLGAGAITVYAPYCTASNLYRLGVAGERPHIVQMLKEV